MSVRNRIRNFFFPFFQINTIIRQFGSVMPFSFRNLRKIQSEKYNPEKFLFFKSTIDKRLFRRYHVRHSSKACRQQNNPKRTMKNNEGALRPRMAAALLLVLFRGKREVGNSNPKQLNNQQRG